MLQAKRIKLFVMLTLILLSNGAAAQAVSKYLFGQNHWMATGDEGERIGYINQLWPQVRQSGVKVVRIGGNGYERRFPPRAKLNAMIDNIKGIGAEPLLQMPRFFSDIQAKELVEYYTQANKRQIKYWSIGNEPRLHNQESIDSIHNYLLRLAKAMREVSNDIFIFAYDEASLRMPDYEELIGGSKDITGLKHNGVWLINGVSFHSYPNAAEFNRDDVVFTGPKKILDQITTLQTLIDKANKKHGRTGEGALQWGLTEFNVAYKNPDREISGYGNTSFLAGQFMAEIFGYGMKYRAMMMNPWCINEVDRISTDFGYLGMPTEFYPRSAYYHMQIMSANMTGEFLSSQDNQQYVKTIATKDNKRIVLLVMNQHPDQSFDFIVDFNEQGQGSSVPLSIVLASGIDRTFSAKIDAQTSVLYVFNKKAKLKKHISYSIKENLKYAAPVVY